MFVFALGALSMLAQEYLTTVRSDVIETPGAAAEIAARGERCIARSFGSGAAGGELIVSREGGVIVARNALTYRDGLLVWQIRSRFTFEARDGRFRTEHSAIERFNDQAGGWSPVGLWWGSGGQKAKEALEAQSEGIASCVLSGGQAEDW